MPTPSHFVACTKKELLTPNVYQLRCTRPQGFTFQAGQFVLLDIPLKDKPTDIQPRALSIASAPTEDDLLFCVKLKQGGRMSVWVDEMLTLGMQVRIQGPFGLFVVKPEADQEYFFVATGAGIAPFRSHILWLLKEKKWQGPLHLIFGVREEKDLFWVAEFERIAAEHSNFQFHLTLSGPTSEWKRRIGRVQTALTDLIKHTTHPHVYICGAPDMVKDVKALCLGDLKLDKKQVHGEGYI